MTRTHLTVLLPALLAVGTLRAANLVEAPVSTLGSDLFVNQAATGGSDFNSSGSPETSRFDRDFGVANLGTGESTVTVTGLAFGMPGGGNTNGNVITATITYLGADGAIGGGDDLVLGSQTATHAYTTGAGVYSWLFDTPVSGVIDGANTMFRITLVSDPANNGGSTNNIRVKTTGGAAGAKISVAGSAVGGTFAVTRTASAGGFWDAITWNTGGGGSVAGDLSESDDAEIGSYREVTYRGVPATETVLDIRLGESSGSGQGTLRLTSGSLAATGDLTVGRGNAVNDSFVYADGGTLHVMGNAGFGRSAGAVDGALIVAGGAVQIDGDLAMGGFTAGGSILRFHNPGSSAPVDVGGTLVLGRTALDLTFDNAYTHLPGSVITLVEYTARDGQFGNIRRGDEFNCGPNRFRIDYDVPGAGKLAIQLTALENFTTQSTPPNVVLLFTDDQGYADLGLNQHPEWAAKYPMPELDALAGSGVRFTDAYVMGGVCHPSRCSLLTGVNQCRFGTDNNLNNNDTGGANYNGMAVSQRTVPRRLQGLGYKTYGIGKWHLGSTLEFHPNVRGFDYWYGMYAGSRSYWDNTSESGVFQDQFTPDFASENGDYLTDRIGDKAVDYIDDHLANHPGQPFYFYVSFTAVHGPMDVNSGPNPTRYNQLNARLLSEFGLDASDYLNSPKVFSGSNQAMVDANRYELAAMTLAVDENIGKIVDKVAAEGLTNDTIFVYLNDNGGAEWASGFGGNYSYNFPLKGKKGGSMQEGSIRVPSAMKWPAEIASGQVVSDPVTSLDLMATIVNAAGAPAGARNGLEGYDLLPLLKDGTPLPAERVITWRGGGVTGGGSAIRQGDWKLIISDSSQSVALYDLASDIGETNNRIGDFPEIAADLRARFDAWEAGTLAPFYGTSATVLDSGLERHGITGGYRLRETTGTPKFLSAPFRNPVAIGADYSFSFLAGASESSHAPGARLWYGLGDSDTRGDLIRVGIDFAAGELLIEEGKTGGTASTPLPAVPTGFEEARIDWDALSSELAFSLGDTTVSLVLTGSYGNLTHFAVGAAAMEGELTTLRPGTGSGLGASAQVETNFTTTGDLRFDLSLDAAPPFPPVLERSLDLNTFATDPDALLEFLGGSRFRVSAPANPAEDAEFFRFNFGNP